MPQVIHDTTSDGSFTGAAGTAPDASLWRVDAAGETVELDGAGACEITTTSGAANPRLWALDPDTGLDYARDAGEWLVNVELVSGDGFWLFARREDDLGVDVADFRVQANNDEVQIHVDSVQEQIEFITVDVGTQVWILHHWATDEFRAKVWTGLEGDEPGTWTYEDITSVPGGGQPVFLVTKNVGLSGTWLVNLSRLVDPNAAAGTYALGRATESDVARSVNVVKAGGSAATPQFIM